MRTNAEHILVTGGAGFIGSHMVLALQAAGYTPIVLDNLSKGHRDAVINAELVVGDIADTALVSSLFQQYTFAAVMHFASFIEVAESVREPEKYYQNNVMATFNLLEVMRQHHVNKFIFSSSAAVYGEPHYSPIDEQHLCAPINPYGSNKKIVEDKLRELSQESDLHFVALRYFNAAGADPRARVCERHEPESHLIPLVLQVATGEREHITIFGRDYETEDGTCVRDYIHVSDLCEAHLLALKRLLNGGDNLTCNLGTGHGFSVQQVVDAARRMTGHAIPVVYSDRREGDPAILVADATLAKRELHWQPQYSNLKTIIQHAWGALKQKAELVS